MYNGQEWLLADLSMEVGDPWHNEDVVRAVYTDTLGRKVVMLSNFSFVEGLGQVGGYYYGVFLGVGLEQQLVCIYHDDERAYFNGDTSRYDEETCKGRNFEGVAPSAYSPASRIYPNPTSGCFRVSPPGWDEFQIVDLSGMVKAQAPLPADGVVDVSHLPKGLYVLQLKKGPISTSTILINRH